MFNFFGSLLGYLLWFLYTIFQNYGVAIILFTVILKAALFPMNVKQQRSMAGQAKLSEKQKLLQAQYANNKTKYNEELQKLYEKEGVNPASGCLTSLIPLPIMFGIYYSVIYPLKNTLHIASETVTAVTEYVGTSTDIVLSNYVELDIIKNWDVLKDSVSSFFTAAEIEKIEFFVDGFEFLGLNLLETPKSAAFIELLWIIPVLSLVFSLLMQFVMSRYSKVKQQGAMKIMLYLLPFMSAYWAYIFPAAVGFYWVTSSLMGIVQSIVTQKFFSHDQLNVMNEAKAYVTLYEKEKKMNTLPENLQRQISNKIDLQNKATLNNQKQGKVDNKKKKSAKSTNKNSQDYLGNKK
ncbi:MAG: YidC/Oxa1 family membrane protein insertase [Clostridia bacterium]